MKRTVRTPARGRPTPSGSSALGRDGGRSRGGEATESREGGAQRFVQRGVGFGA